MSIFITKIKNLKTLLTFSILILFNFRIALVSAQEEYETFPGPTCNEFINCWNNPESKYDASDIDIVRDKELLDYICMVKTNFKYAQYVKHTSIEDNSEKFKIYKSNNEENIFLTKKILNSSKSINTISCEIPDIEEEEGEEEFRQIKSEKKQEEEKENQQNIQTPPLEPIKQIIGCTDPTAINHNSQANVHDERSCIYPIVEKPYEQKDITGYIENTQVQSGATTFNLRLNLNVTGATLDISKIQIWNQFTPINSVTQDNKIIITLQKFNGQRLDVECNSYELTIPKNSITKNIEIKENNQTKQIIEKNSNPITGNFTVVGCQDNNQGNQNQQDLNTQNNDEENQDQENQNKSTIKENGFYISIFDTDENGKQYINLVNTIYLLGFLMFFLFLFFLFFSFLKNSFLGARIR